MNSKIIPINKIKKIELVELNAFNGKYKLFGLSPPLTYYHFDSKRSNKTHVIFLEEEDNIFQIGITPDEQIKWFNALKHLKTQKDNNEKGKKVLDPREESDLLVENKEKKN